MGIKDGDLFRQGRGQLKNLTEDFYCTEGQPLARLPSSVGWVDLINLFACLGPKKPFPFIIAQCHCPIDRQFKKV